jgi:hypothetical protein
MQEQYWSALSNLTVCHVKYRTYRMCTLKTSVLKVGNWPVSKSELNNRYLEQFIGYVNSMGTRGGVVVKALSYKPVGRGFDSRWCHWNFSVT